MSEYGHFGRARRCERRALVLLWIVLGSALVWWFALLYFFQR